MDHMRLSDELRAQLMEAAAWGKAGIDREVEQLDEAKKAKKDEKKEKMKPAYEEAEVEEVEDEEELTEAVHICPLCTSELEESLDPDQIVEHLDVVMALYERLSQIQESDEDLDDVVDGALADVLFGDDEEDED